MIILFMGHISLHVDVTDKNQTTKCEQFFFAPTELGVLHIPLHNTDKSFRITEVCISNLIKNNCVTCANLTDLSCVEIDEKLRRSSLSPRKDMRIVRNIPVKVGLARFSWRKFNHVVIVFNQWNTTTEVQELLATAQPRRVDATVIDQQSYPLIRT